MSLKIWLFLSSSFFSTSFNLSLIKLLWTEVHDIVQEAVIKTIPKKMKCKNTKWLSEEALQIALKRREVEGKGEKERYTHVNAEFQRIARRDSSLSRSLVFLYFFTLIAEEGFLISSCYSLELCIQMDIPFFLLCLSLLFFSQLFVNPPQRII